MKGAASSRRGRDQALFEYIDVFYNARRIQKGLGWRCLDEFEAARRAGELTERDCTRLAELAALRRTRPASKRDAAASSPRERPPAPDETTSRATVIDARPNAVARHPGSTRHTAARPAARPGTAEQIQPSERALTTTRKSRPTG